MLRPRGQTCHSKYMGELGSIQGGQLRTHPGKTQNQKRQEFPFFNLLEERKDGPNSVNIIDCDKCNYFHMGFTPILIPSHPTPTSQPRRECQSGKGPWSLANFLILPMRKLSVRQKNCS